MGVEREAYERKLEKQYRRLETVSLKQARYFGVAFLRQTSAPQVQARTEWRGGVICDWGFAKLERGKRKLREWKYVTDGELVVGALVCD